MFKFNGVSAGIIIHEISIFCFITVNFMALLEEVFTWGSNNCKAIFFSWKFNVIYYVYRFENQL